jgi:Putative peptidoglycan binding domain
MIRMTIAIVSAMILACGLAGAQTLPSHPLTIQVPRVTSGIQPLVVPVHPLTPAQSNTLNQQVTQFQRAQTYNQNRLQPNLSLVTPVTPLQPNLHLVKPIQTTGGLNAALGYGVGQVRETQRALQRLGFYTGGIDGVYGPQTESAIAAYQAKNNQTVNGLLNRWVLGSLGIVTH